MKKLDLLYVGKAKKVYATEDPNLCIFEYKDDATAFNGLKKVLLKARALLITRWLTLYSSFLKRMVLRLI